MVTSVLADQSIKLTNGGRWLQWLHSLEDLVEDANAGIHWENFCLKVLIEKEVGKESISKHKQLGLEKETDRKHVQRKLTLNQINSIIYLAIAGCELASEFR